MKVRALLFLSFALVAPGCETTPDKPDVVEEASDAWRLSDGRVQFTAVKNGDTPVTGTFTAVSGEIDLGDFPKLSGEIAIDLSSLDTAEPVRDEKLLRHFFEVTQSTNSIAKYIPERFNGAEFLPQAGTEPVPGELEGALSVHGVTVWVSLPVTLSRNAAGKLLVETRKDADLSINSLEMKEEKKALMEACGHKSVSDAVQLRFSSAFAPAGAL